MGVRRLACWSGRLHTTAQRNRYITEIRTSVAARGWSAPGGLDREKDRLSVSGLLGGQIHERVTRLEPAAAATPAAPAQTTAVSLCCQLKTSTINEVALLQSFPCLAGLMLFRNV